MTIQRPIQTNATPTAPQYPAVLNFRKLHPRELGKFRMHDQRRGGDLSHVDMAASALNVVLHGEPDWIKQIRDEIQDARLKNHVEYLEALKRKSRHKDAATLTAAGPSDPWRGTSDGPMREGILTVNKVWFGGTGHAQWDEEKVRAFQEAALAFLRANFPDGQLRYASAHHDEEAYHIHFVILVWKLRTSKNRGQQRLIQAAANPLLASYERAQDLIGEALRPLGICRGMRRAEQRRNAKWAGLPPDPPRRHIPPSMYRQTEIAEGQAEAERIIQSAQEKANAMMAAAEKSKREMARAADAAKREMRAARETMKRLEDEIATKKEQEKAASIIDTLNMGLELYAEGAFVLNDGEGSSGPEIEWTARARHLDQDEVREQLSPALPMLMRFTGALSGAMGRLIAEERRRLADDASYLAALRDMLTPEQDKRLSEIAADGGLDQPGR